MATSDSSHVRRDFKLLRARLRRLQHRYNPARKNLYFDALSQGDADLYPSIVALAEEGLRIVRQRHTFFSKHALYADGMFWYDLFLFISAAASRTKSITRKRMFRQRWLTVWS